MATSLRTVATCSFQAMTSAVFVNKLGRLVVREGFALLSIQAELIIIRSQMLCAALLTVYNV